MTLPFSCSGGLLWHLTVPLHVSHQENSSGPSHAPKDPVSQMSLQTDCSWETALTVTAAHSWPPFPWELPTFSPIHCEQGCSPESRQRSGGHHWNNRFGTWLLPSLLWGAPGFAMNHSNSPSWGYRLCRIQGCALDSTIALVQEDPWPQHSLEGHHTPCSTGWSTHWTHDPSTHSKSSPAALTWCLWTNTVGRISYRQCTGVQKVRDLYRLEVGLQEIQLWGA